MIQKCGLDADYGDEGLIAESGRAENGFVTFSIPVTSVRYSASLNKPSGITVVEGLSLTLVKSLPESA